MAARKIAALVSLLILHVMLFSCQNEADVEPVEEVIPLQVGNRWDYHVINYFYDGGVIDTTSFTRMVVKDTVIQNSTWYVLSDGYVVRNNGEGYVYYNFAGSQAVILYQSQSYGGIGYGYQYPNYMQYVLTTRSSALAPVPGSVHNYTAYLFKVEYQNTENNSGVTSSSFKHDYVTPGIGLVRSDLLYGDTGKVMRRFELKSYRLN